jgi:hypothetical protein
MVTEYSARLALGDFVEFSIGVPSYWELIPSGSASSHLSNLLGQ